jgi:hypothetical protein
MSADDPVYVNRLVNNQVARNEKLIELSRKEVAEIESTASATCVFSVGAGLLAMVVNDIEQGLTERGAFESIASKPAPTEGMRTVPENEISVSSPP